MKDDPRGGPCYNRNDIKRVETTWRDRLRKEDELRHHVREAGFTANFQMNLANTSANCGFVRVKHSHNRLEMVTEKAQHKSPKERSSIEGMDPTSMEIVAQKHADRRPAEKWDMPATMSQDMGWLLCNPVRSSTLAKPLNRASSTGGFSMPDTQGGTISSMNNLAMSLTTPANQHVLERMRSNPELPRGPAMAATLKLNNRRWCRPKASCDVTTYAVAYAETMQGVSPFSKNQPTR